MQWRLVATEVMTVPAIILGSVYLICGLANALSVDLVKISCTAVLTDGGRVFGYDICR